MLRNLLKVRILGRIWWEYWHIPESTNQYGAIIFLEYYYILLL